MTDGDVESPPSVRFDSRKGDGLPVEHLKGRFRCEIGSVQQSIRIVLERINIWSLWPDNFDVESEFRGGQNRPIKLLGASQSFHDKGGR